MLRVLVESWRDYAFAIDCAFVSIMFICFACVFCFMCQLMVWNRASEEVKVGDWTSRLPWALEGGEEEASFILMI